MIIYSLQVFPVAESSPQATAAASFIFFLFEKIKIQRSARPFPASQAGNDVAKL